MASTATPGLSIEAPSVTFPDTYQFSTVRHTFRFVNQGPREVRIEEGLGLKEGAQVTFRPARVPPGGTGTIDVSQDLLTNLGASSFRFAIITDEPGVSRYRMSLSGFVLSAYAPEQPLVSFGRVTRGNEAHRSIELFSREVDRLEVRRVEGAPDFLRVAAERRAGLAGEGLVVSVQLQEHPPLGLSTGHFTLWTNVESQPQFLVSYAVEAFGDIEADPHPLAFELVRMGEPKTVDVRLRSRSGNAFEVKDATDSLGVMDLETEPCAGTGSGPSSCVVLHVTALVEGPLNLAGVVTVKIAGDPEPLPLSYGGWVVAPQTEVRQLGTPGVDSLFTESREPKTPTPPAAPAPVAPAAAPAAPPAKGSRLAWKARNDEVLYGYVVYRADKEIGPFRRVSDVIRAQSVPETTHQYEFVDATAQPGRTYFYYVDTVNQRGLTERFSPVRAHTASGR